MITINEQKGFTLTFNNGWTISVQIGHMNYCANKNNGPFNKTWCTNSEPCINAEIAIWDSEDNWYAFDDPEQEVKGWVSTDDVALWIEKVKGW